MFNHRGFLTARLDSLATGIWIMAILLAAYDGNSRSTDCAIVNWAGSGNSATESNLLLASWNFEQIQLRNTFSCNQMRSACSGRIFVI